MRRRIATIAIVIIVIVGWAISPLLGIGMVAILILLGLLVWFILAPRNICFTFVKEGNAKIILRGGAYDRVIFQWNGRFIDSEGEIWEEVDKPKFRNSCPNREINDDTEGLFGGLYYIGLYPFYSILKQERRWVELKRKEGDRQVDQPFWAEAKERDYIFLQSGVYWTKVFSVETGGKERIPVDVEVLVTMRVANPRLFAFTAPPNTWDGVLARIDALIRGKVGQMSLDEILALRGEEESLWKKIEGDSFIKKTLPSWGVEVFSKGVEVRNIELPSDYQEAGALRKKTKLQAEARAQQIFGTIVASLVEVTNLPKEEIRKKLLAGETDLLKMVSPSIMGVIAMENEAITIVKVDGAEGIEKALINIITTMQKAGGKKAFNTSTPAKKKIRRYI